MEIKVNDLNEVFLSFLKMGFIAFGGPAAHIAMMEEEFVNKRKWVSADHFLDLIGATNLIPGPNSTEMVMHLGYERGGGKGLCLATLGFLFPAVCITLILAVLYVRHGDLPELESFVFGVKPAVIAIIITAVWRLGKKSIRSSTHIILMAVLVGLYFVGVGEVALLFIGGLVGVIIFTIQKGDTRLKAHSVLPLLFWTSQASQTSGLETGQMAPWKLFLFFIKIGSVLYGSGYVLIAFLEGDLVDKLGLLTQSQLLDAIAVGQATPGPVLSTSTFIGYLLGSYQGALLATLGIFLPSTVFVWFLNKRMEIFRSSKWLSRFLDAINVASLALMLSVSINLAISSLTSWPTVLIAVLSAVLVLRFKISTVYVIGMALILGKVLWLMI